MQGRIVPAALAIRYARKILRCAQDDSFPTVLLRAVPVPAMYATLLLLQAPSGNSFFAPLALYAVIALIFYFVLFRPQQAQRRRHDAAVRAIKRGDAVVTAGGIVGEVVSVRELTSGAPSAEDHVTIRSGESRLVVERGKIAKTASRGAATAAPASSAGTNAG